MSHIWNITNNKQQQQIGNIFDPFNLLLLFLFSGLFLDQPRNLNIWKKNSYHLDRYSYFFHWLSSEKMGKYFSCFQMCYIQETFIHLLCNKVCVCVCGWMDGCMVVFFFFIFFIQINKKFNNFIEEEEKEKLIFQNSKFKKT